MLGTDVYSLPAALASLIEQIEQRHLVELFAFQVSVPSSGSGHMADSHTYQRCFISH